MKVIRLKARAYGSELLCGKIQLLDVPSRVRLKNAIYYICAMQYYIANNKIPNPFYILRSDLAEETEDGIGADMISLSIGYSSIFFKESISRLKLNIEVDTTLQSTQMARNFLRKIKNARIDVIQENSILQTGGLIYGCKSPLAIEKLSFKLGQVK